MRLSYELLSIRGNRGKKLPQLSIPEHRKQEVIYCDISTLSEEEQMCKVNATAEECRNRKRNLARGDIMGYASVLYLREQI